MLFVELLPRTSTGPELDPEAMLELVGGALTTIVGEVESLGGKVTSVSGTGVLAVFGAPDAHEDDPERALRAAFRVLNGTSTLSGEVALRAGVETGPAVTGPIGGGSSGHYGAVGEVVSIAGPFSQLPDQGPCWSAPLPVPLAKASLSGARRQTWRSREGQSGCAPPTSGAPRRTGLARPPDEALSSLCPSSAVCGNSTFFGSHSAMRLAGAAVSSS